MDSAALAETQGPLKQQYRDDPGSAVVVLKADGDLEGSGIACRVSTAQAMVEAGLLLGLPRAVAHDLVVQTAVGATTMLRDSGDHPVALREAVTSPAGTTASALRELERHGVRAAFLAALEAARDRSRELAAGAG